MYKRQILGILVWNYNPDFSSVQLPNVQLAGGENSYFNLKSALSFFKKSNTDHSEETQESPSSPGKEDNTVTTLRPGGNRNDIEFEDLIPGKPATIVSLDDDLLANNEAEGYKPQYADLNGLREDTTVSYTHLDVYKRQT